MAGITSDANLLTNELRLIGQRYKYQYGESIPCEQLVSWLCDIKQAYTQSGGKRPFGVSILYMGWDKHFGYQLVRFQNYLPLMKFFVSMFSHSSTSLIPLATMGGGKQLALETTGMPPSLCSSRSTRFA